MRKYCPGDLQDKIRSKEKAVAEAAIDRFIELLGYLLLIKEIEPDDIENVETIVRNSIKQD